MAYFADLAAITAYDETIIVGVNHFQIGLTKQELVEWLYRISRWQINIDIPGSDYLPSWFITAGGYQDDTGEGGVITDNTFTEETGLLTKLEKQGGFGYDRPDHTEGFFSSDIASLGVGFDGALYYPSVLVSGVLEDLNDEYSTSFDEVPNDPPTFPAQPFTGSIYGKDITIYASGYAPPFAGLTITPTEWFAFDPGDGGGPTYDIMTGTQIRSHVVQAGQDQHGSPIWIDLEDF